MHCKKSSGNMLTPSDLYNCLKNVKIGASICSYSMDKCAELVPLINEINELKLMKNAVILAHSYVSPEIIYGVSDFVGDSYKLSRDALSTHAEIIVFASVRFMAETAKTLNPRKKVFIPSQDAGCTLADSITPEDVVGLRKKFPTHTFVAYINTTAEVKSLVDVCVTSSNVYDIVEMIDNHKIYFLPDKFMGLNLQNEMKKRDSKKVIDFYHGTCYVHEEYSPDMIKYIRMEFPHVKVVSHPECSPDVLQDSHFVGSTSQIMDYVEKEDASQYLLLTECGLSARLQVERPEKTFVGSCTMCRFMKSNTLQGILDVLKNPRPENEILLSSEVLTKANHSIENMFFYLSQSQEKKRRLLNANS